jgi:histone acetyltransferase (RNA polymerase elongator complex component)
MKHVIIPIFVPHKGCPNDCIFCNQKKISGQISDMTPEKINEIVEEHLKTIKQDAFVEIAFYGGSFTAIEEELQQSFLREAYKYAAAGRVSEIRLSTRPDRIDSKILDMLELYGVRTIELGVQSLDDVVLRASCRGHDASCVYRSCELIKSRGFRLGIQTMTGLPGDTRDKCITTAKKVISLSPDMVRIYPVLVIKGTGLEELMKAGLYKPQRLDEAVDICAELLEMYEGNGINVIRIGLQPTDNIREENSDVSAGPFHPAFRQLVESRLVLRRIESNIISQRLQNAQEITIHTGISNISNAVGQKKSNISYLKNKYGFKKIRVLPSEDASGDIACTAISCEVYMGNK